MKPFTDLWPLPWPEIVVVTGPFGCGKSTFTLGTGATPERTLVIDFEKSQKSFAAQLPLTYMDMQAVMGESYPTGYKMIDLFKKTCEIVDKVESGRYDIIVLDNASNLEDGITAYVEANPAEFGHSAAQYNNMSGLKWGDVKNKYQQVLTRWVSKARMIFIVVHLRDKWAGNSIIKDAFGRPVQEPKGKETLDQLSSLFVWLEHGPGGVPAARVLKNRIDKKVFVSDPTNPPEGIPAMYLKELNGEAGLVSVPVLPLRLPKCTWQQIREYMRNPADLSSPKPGELPTEAQMNEDDRLKLRAIIADREAEKANVDRMRMESASAQQAQRPQPQQQAKAPAPAQSNGNGNGSARKPASQPAATPVSAPAAVPQNTMPAWTSTLISMESAMKVTSGDGKLVYWTLETPQLVYRFNGLVEALKKNGLTPEKKTEAEMRRDAIKAIIDYRNLIEIPAVPEPPAPWEADIPEMFQ